MSDTTKERTLEVGLRILLRHGYNDLGVQAVLEEAGIPKGSFYHHFASKEDFALQVVDRYMRDVHQGLDASLGDTALAPLQRVRKFFDCHATSIARMVSRVHAGGLGQELSGISPVFQKRSRLVSADCKPHRRLHGRSASHRCSAAGSNPRHLANLIVDCWEGPFYGAASVGIRLPWTRCLTSISQRLPQHRCRKPEPP